MTIVKFHTKEELIQTINELYPDNFLDDFWLHLDSENNEIWFMSFKPKQ